MANSLKWFQILEKARELSPNGSERFNAEALSNKCGFEKTKPSVIERGPRKGKMGEGSTPKQIASGWLSKFVKWGYVQVVGTTTSDGPRPANVYTVTQAGHACEVRPGLKERLQEAEDHLQQAEGHIGQLTEDLQALAGNLQSLLEAVQAFRDLRGKPAEGQAWKDLLKTTRELEEGLEEQGKARNP